MAKATAIVTAHVPKSLHRAMRMKLADEERTFSAWLREAMQRYVADKAETKASGRKAA